MYLRTTDRRTDRRLTLPRLACYILVLIAAYLAGPAITGAGEDSFWSYGMPCSFRLTLEDQRLGPQQNPPITSAFGTFPQVGETYDLTDSELPLTWRREWEVLRVIHLHGEVGAKIWVQ